MWTYLQFVDTGKFMLYSSYERGFNYRLFLDGDHTLDLATPSEIHVIACEYWEVPLKQFHINSYELINDKPVLCPGHAGFEFTDRTLQRYTQEYLIEKIQEYFILSYDDVNRLSNFPTFNKQLLSKYPSLKTRLG